MRCRLYCLALLGILAFHPAGATSLAEGKPRVRWMTLDFPPLFMVSGPEHGVGDYAQGVAVSSLGEYDHVLQAVPPNFQRIEQEIKTHDDVCFAGFLKTPERERFMAFSQPYVLMLPVQLYVPYQRPQPPVGAGGQVDLQALLEGKAFSLGILGGRRYGASVEAVIAPFSDSQVVYRRYSKDQLSGLINMMGSHEYGLDGILAYASEINYQKAQAGEKSMALRGYPLKGAPPFLFGYFACSASNLGRQVIARIDQAIPGIRAQVAQLYANDLDPPARAAYARLIQQQWGLALTPE
jgi:uncharacterized protein (TIGR02285 family)